MYYVSPPISNEVFKVLWRIDQVPQVLWLFPTVINPAVSVGDVSCWKWERGLLWVPRSPWAWGSLSPGPVPRLAGPLSADGALRRGNHSVRRTLGSVSGSRAIRLLSPFPLEVLKGIEERWWWCCVLGEPYFPNGNCTFGYVLCSLCGGKQFILCQALRGAGWPGWAGSSWVLYQGSPAILGCWVKLGLGDGFQVFHVGPPLARLSWRAP